MMPGTWPDWRSLRATPVPVPSRFCADSDAVAMRILPKEVIVFAASSRRPTYTLRRLRPPYHVPGFAARSIEQRAHTLLRVGETNRLGQQLADAQHHEPVDAPLFGNADGIGDRDF